MASETDMRPKYKVVLQLLKENPVGAIAVIENSITETGSTKLENLDSFAANTWNELIDQAIEELKKLKEPT